MDLNFNYQVPIREQGLIDGEFLIEGTAINTTVTSNNHKFLSEELRMSAGTLRGVPLLADHRNEIDSIKGRVLNGTFDESTERVNFKATVIDETAKQMIKDGRLNSVSVGAAVESVEEGEDGTFIPRGITFKELSLVAVPADSGATFGLALKEAYLSQSHSPSGDFNTVKKEDKEMKEVEEKKNVTETEEEAKPEETKEEEEVKAEAEPEVEAEEAKEEVESNETTEALKSQIAELTKSVEALKESMKVKEADGDEAEAEAETEEKSEDEEEAEEAEEVSESYKIVQGHKAFSLIRNKY